MIDSHQQASQLESPPKISREHGIESPGDDPATQAPELVKSTPVPDTGIADPIQDPEVQQSGSEETKDSTDSDGFITVTSDRNTSGKSHGKSPPGNIYPSPFETPGKDSTSTSHTNSTVSSAPPRMENSKPKDTSGDISMDNIIAGPRTRSGASQNTQDSPEIKVPSTAQTDKKSPVAEVKKVNNQNSKKAATQSVSSQTPKQVSNTKPKQTNTPKTIPIGRQDGGAGRGKGRAGRGSPWNNTNARIARGKPTVANPQQPKPQNNNRFSALSPIDHEDDHPLSPDSQPQKKEGNPKNDKDFR